MLLTQLNYRCSYEASISIFESQKRYHVGQVYMIRPKVPICLVRSRHGSTGRTGLERCCGLSTDGAPTMTGKQMDLWACWRQSWKIVKTSNWYKFIESSIKKPYVLKCVIWIRFVVGCKIGKLLSVSRTEPTTASNHFWKVLKLNMEISCITQKNIGYVAKQFLSDFLLHDGIQQFMESKGNVVNEFSSVQRVADLAFLVYTT